MIEPSTLERKDFDLVAIGASAGGISALQLILRELPPKFPIPIVIVLHLPPDTPSLLPEIFGKWAAIPVSEPEDKEPVEPGRIYVAPPGYHLMIEADRVFCLNLDDPVYFSIPSIDVLFESVARVYGAKSLGIILTGANEDGANGLRAIDEAGGLAFIQAPTTAQSTAMPLAALKKVPAGNARAPAEIGTFLAALVR